MDILSLDLTSLRAAYDGGAAPTSVLGQVYDRIEAAGLDPI